MQRSRPHESPLLGLEPIGTEVILTRFSGDIGSVTAALEAASARVKAMGSQVTSSQIQTS